MGEMKGFRSRHRLQDEVMSVNRVLSKNAQFMTIYL